ncbi:hypothetical protein TNCV_208301 [Trichonephila clavipes]|uniref:Uncharacterized protein n=1 Tax=Trichonephila clavipes TaxID=2585209 RepID=A0A8X6VRW7_TRICX|nr:hypothetical protein TNCV_208301 [Trichonephila clavipes]
MYQDLAASYENSKVPNSFGGVEALHRSLNGKYSKKDVKHWLSQKDVYTLHKSVRHKFQRNRVFFDGLEQVGLETEHVALEVTVHCLDFGPRRQWVLMGWTKPYCLSF